MKEKKIIELNQVSHVFETSEDALHVIQDISLSIDACEFVCVVGPSGCGKSTLLKMIAGFLKPTLGECFMLEEKIEGPDKKRGVVFQSPTLYPWLTVANNIGYGPKLAKENKKEIEQSVNEYLKEVDLLEFKDRYPFELSGGMKQRVAIGRTLVNNPEVILMDEPFSALDAITRVGMQTMLRKIWKEKKQTVFMITHDIEEALKLGTRIIVMSKNPGKIIYECHVDYTNQIYNNDNYFVEQDSSFHLKKMELYDLIV
ncbi:MAG: ABC transporter ATP-binding protein [Vagococcus sp.]|jgi:taurine transport system ATP-binding protein|nr:ABC transporter ATP-binding protein [Vagococcus sp.]